MGTTLNEVLGYGIPIAWIGTLLALYWTLPPVARLVGATVGLLWSIKVGAWLVLRARGDDFSMSTGQLLCFWTVWPGVRPDLFARGHAEGQEPTDRSPDGRTFLKGWVYGLLGVGLVAASLLAPPHIGLGPSTWLLLFGLVSIVHMGVGRILPFGLRWLGYPAPDLFVNPLASRSVAEFWSTRWNRPFITMDRLFVTRPLAPKIGMAAAAAVAFTVSGLLHELAISYAAGAGWGLPAVYFLIQGVAYTAEKRLDLGVAERPITGRIWTFGVLFLPVPLLFHAPFRTTFLGPPIEIGRDVLLAYPASSYLSVGLWLAAAGHFLVLAASYQVPKQLEWESDLAGLKSLNRKLMWTYGGFIVLTIVAFGVLTVAFHEQFVAGDPVALGLAAFVAVFWTARILVDTLYFDHDDWPSGLEFVVGHAMLTSLFVFLVAVYAGTIAVHVL